MERSFRNSEQHFRTRFQQNLQELSGQLHINTDGNVVPRDPLLNLPADRPRAMGLFPDLNVEARVATSLASDYHQLDRPAGSRVENIERLHNNASLRAISNDAIFQGQQTSSRWNDPNLVTEANIQYNRHDNQVQELRQGIRNLARNMTLDDITQVRFSRPPDNNSIRSSDTFSSWSLGSVPGRDENDRRYSYSGVLDRQQSVMRETIASEIAPRGRRLSWEQEPRVSQEMLDENQTATQSADPVQELSAVNSSQEIRSEESTDTMVDQEDIEADELVDSSAHRSIDTMFERFEDCADRSIDAMFERVEDVADTSVDAMFERGDGADTSIDAMFERVEDGVDRSIDAMLNDGEGNNLTAPIQEVQSPIDEEQQYEGEGEGDMELINAI
ncbi:hypothetical protein HK102_003955 [Quaeritorhiza haematococci]|nr:hypothetical protein HK102_003955 [Quaeritorhiza haematococci]